MVISSPVDSIRITATLTRLLRLVDERLRLSADDQVGLTELGVLGAIESGIELPSAIARLMRLDPGRVTRVVDLLVKQGYIKRGVDAHDRRRCPLSLTVEGNDRLRDGRAIVTATMGSVVGKLEDDHRDNLISALDNLRAVLDELPPPMATV